MMKTACSQKVYSSVSWKVRRPKSYDL